MKIRKTKKKAKRLFFVTIWVGGKEFPYQYDVTAKNKTEIRTEMMKRHKNIKKIIIR